MSDTPVRKSCLSLCEDLGASSLPDGPRGSNSQCHGCVYSMIYFVFNNNFSCLPARPTNILSMSASRDKLFLCHLLLKYLKKCPHTLRRQNCSVSRRLRERISGEVVKGGVGEVSLGRIDTQAGWGCDRTSWETRADRSPNARVSLPDVTDEL